jgi:hypothetical protein
MGYGYYCVINSFPTDAETLDEALDDVRVRELDRESYTHYLWMGEDAPSKIPAKLIEG